MRGRRRVRFIRDLVLTGGTQIAQAGALMGAGVLVSRFIGPSGYGTLAVLMALGTMAVLLTSLGVHYSGIYFIGRFESRSDAVIANNLLFGVIGGLATGAALTALVLLFPRQLISGISFATFLLFVGFVPCNYFNQFARRLALGAGRLGTYNSPDLITGAGLLVGTAAALLVFGHHLVPLVALRAGIEGLAAVVLLVRVSQLVRDSFAPSRRLLREQVGYGLRNYASSLVWLLLLQSDLVLCNDYLGRGSAGVYSLAVSLGLPVTLVASVLGTLVFQRVSRDQDRLNRVANTNRVLRLLTAFGAVVGVVSAAAAQLVVPWIYGQQFDGASVALAILMPGLMLLSLETVLMSFLGGEGSPSIVYKAPVVGLLLNFGVNLLVIPRWGIDGAAATSSVSYAVVFVLVVAHYARSTGSSPSEMFRVRTSDLRAVWPEPVGLELAGAHGQR